MRPLIAMLCWTLFFYGTPLRAEPTGGFDSTGVEAEGDSESPGVDRPWLRRPLDVRLAQASEEAGIGDVDAQIADLKEQRAGISRKWPLAGVIAGGILAGGGLILLGTSGWILAKRNHERKAIDRQIEKLQNGRTARTAPSWGIGFDLGERKGLRVAWRY